MVPLAIDALGAAAYAGNCHKWLCAPKGAAFLSVREDWRERVRPLVVSHGWNTPRTDRSRFRLEFDWTGTHDPTPWLCVPEAIRFLGGLLPGGWPALLEHNRHTALAERARLAKRLGTALPCPDALVGSMACVLLPDRPSGAATGPDADPLQIALWQDWRVEIPVTTFPAPPRTHVRLSAQLYNGAEDWARLGQALDALLGSTA